MIVSALYPRFRDVSIIWSVFAMALFYATPVLYPIEVVSEQLPEPDRDQPADADPRPRPALGHRAGRRGRGTARMGGPVRLAIAVGALRGGLRVRGLDLPPRGAADRRGALSVAFGGGGRGGAITAPARTIATSVTAGICQSQSSGEWAR